MDLIKLFVIPLSLAIIAYLTKVVFDLFMANRDRRFKLYERQLSEFYWPIYIRLHNNDAVWLRMMEKDNSSNNIGNKIAEKIEDEVILKNHVEIENIIKSSIHIALPDKILIRSIKDYLKHVEIYKAIRAVDIKDKYPGQFNAEYPKNFERLIEKRTIQIQEKLNKIYRNFKPWIPADLENSDKKGNKIVDKHF
jgi:hypothetical protein